MNFFGVKIGTGYNTKTREIRKISDFSETHVVSFSYKELHRHGSDIHPNILTSSTISEMIEERMMRWIIENLNGPWYLNVESDSSDFYFVDERDAIAFKLFWG